MNPQQLAAHAVFDVSINGGPRTYFHNLVPTQGRNTLLDVVFGSMSKPSGLFLAPFSGNVTPANSWTGVNFNDVATEFINYTAATRPALVVGAAENGGLNNHAARAEITVGPATGPNDLLFRGVAVLTSPTKQASSNVLLLSAARLPTDRTGLVEGDVLSLGFAISLSNP